MGALTFAQFQTEILAGLGNRTENTSVTPERILNALNLAQSRVARSYDFSELALTSFAPMNFTGDPGLDKYLTPPPNVKTIHSFVLLDTSSGFSSLGQSKKVIEKPWRWFDMHYPAPEWLPPGWPSIYARWGKFIVMVPSPMMQFTAQLRFISYPAAFDGTPAQVSDFENKDDVIINYVLAYFNKLLGRADRAAYFEGLAKEQLDEAIERDDTRPDIEISRDVADAGLSTQGPYWADPWVRQVS